MCDAGGATIRAILRPDKIRDGWPRWRVPTRRVRSEPGRGSQTLDNLRAENILELVAINARRCVDIDLIAEQLKVSQSALTQPLIASPTPRTVLTAATLAAALLKSKSRQLRLGFESEFTSIFVLCHRLLGQSTEYSLHI